MRKFIVSFIALLVAAIVFVPRGNAANVMAERETVAYGTVDDMRDWACVYGYGGWNGGVTEDMRKDWRVYAADALGGEGGTHWATVNAGNTKTTLVKKSANPAEETIIGECSFDPENVKFHDVNADGAKAGNKAYNLKQLIHAHGINLGQVANIDCSDGVKSVNAWAVDVEGDSIAYGTYEDAAKDVETSGGTLKGCHMGR